MDDPTRFFHALHAVEQGVATRDQAREIICFATVARQTWCRQRARRVLEERQHAAWMPLGLGLPVSGFGPPA